MHRLFVRIAVRSCLLALIRLVLFHFNDVLKFIVVVIRDEENSTLEQGPPPQQQHQPTSTTFKVFSVAAFSQLFTGFFFFAGIIFSSVLTQYRECEAKVDDAICAFHEFADNVELNLHLFRASGTTTTTEDEEEKGKNDTTRGEHRQRAQREFFLEPARRFLRCWVDSLNRPPQDFHVDNSGTWSCDSANNGTRVRKNDPPPTEHANNSLNSCFRDMISALTRSSPSCSSSSCASSLFLPEVLPQLEKSLSAPTLKCIEKFRQCSHRVWTIRRTRVLEPAQLYLNVMLVVVLVCILVVDWPSSPMIAEFVCVAGASACSLLIHALIRKLDDPFDKHKTTSSLSKGRRISLIIFQQRVVHSAGKVLSLLLRLNPARETVGAAENRNNNYNNHKEPNQNSATRSTDNFDEKSKMNDVVDDHANVSANDDDDDDDNSGIRISVKPLLEAASSRM